MLARREHSEWELTKKLLHKKFPAEDIPLAIAILVQKNLINNARFVEHYVYYRRQKGYGPLRIRLELIKRGIAEDLIEQHLNIADNAWLDHAKNIFQKRFKNKFPHDIKLRAQQMRFLQYRGFTREHIESVWKSCQKN